MIEIIDDFLTPTYFKQARDMVESPQFPWNFNNRLSNTDEDELGGIGFQCTLIENTRKKDCYEQVFLSPALMQIQDQVGKDDIFRARLDMTMYNPENYRHPLHVDYLGDENAMSSILYLNESDGNTIIADEEVELKPNRLIIFESKIKHTGHSPSKHKQRVLLNAVFV